ncbi:MAG: polymer-forming cytoskeletal protein [Alkaliphilus sp.]|nr:polymer-forming cytoskeletal protein [Alkaliphilus sp.]
MFKRNEVISNEKINTLIGQNTKFEGVLHAEGVIRVDGEFHGEIILNGNLILGEEGKIFGNITAHNIVLSGMVNGNIKASNLLRICSSGKVIGDIHIGHLIVEEKAVFSGKCKMQDSNECTETATT